MEVEIKKSHSYNVNEHLYKKAKLRALKSDGYLANLLENVVICYGLGLDIQAITTIGDTSKAIDVFDMKPHKIVEIIQGFKKAKKAAL